MAPRAISSRTAGLLAALLMTTLTACGGKDSQSPPPTVANLNDLATSAAQTAAAGATGTSPAALMPTPTETPPPPRTFEASPTTPAPSLTPSALPVTPTTPREQQEATGIALTNTALAGALPITQTMGAISGATQTYEARAALFTPTPSATLSPTPVPPQEAFQVVFYSNRSGNDDLFLATLNGTSRALLAGPSNEREPSCSPDGDSVVFASDASGSYQIYRLRLNETQPVALTNSEGMNFAPVFSPDGSTIAFVSTRSSGIPTIWLMDADGANQRQVTTDLGRDTSPSWGPDGQQLLFASDQNGLWNLFLSVLGEDVEGEFPVLPPEFNEVNQVLPLFDPQGERIAYTVWKDLNDPQTADIYLLDFELEQPGAIRSEAGADIAWAWGDDTHLLASVGGPDNVQIALVDVTTGEAVPITNAGTFNGGAHLCTVDPSLLPPEPSPAPSPTPTKPAPPTITPSPTIALTKWDAPGIPKALLKAAGRQHIVQPGENLLGISYVYGVSLATLVDLNALADPDRLSIGQLLTVPVTRKGYLASGVQVPDPDGEDPFSTRKEIVVDLSKQRVYAYENGRLVRTVLASTGLPATPTVQGDFRIYNKLLAQTMTGPGYYLPDVPYVMYFYQGYGLHGTYWHNNFGHPMSHGCVNLPTSEAEWFYTWAEIGTKVHVQE